jgi:hypothetical protein
MVLVGFTDISTPHLFFPKFRAAKVHVKLAGYLNFIGTSHSTFRVLWQSRRICDPIQPIKNYFWREKTKKAPNGRKFSGKSLKLRYSLHMRPEAKFGVFYIIIVPSMNGLLYVWCTFLQVSAIFENGRRTLSAIFENGGRFEMERRRFFI